MKISGWTLMTVVLTIAGCTDTSSETYEQSDTCSNLVLIVAKLYRAEEVSLYVDQERIFWYKADSSNSVSVYRKFCIDYSLNSTVRVTTKIGGKRYIDKTFWAPKREFGYFLSITYPHPPNWKDYYDPDKSENPVKKEPGKLTLQNSVRTVRLKPETIYKHSFID